jgi:ABC-2 type transport system permease protein/lipopolysaccharide transport system permease protein
MRESIRELWRTRELVRTLAERDLRARYKQAVLGFAWALIPAVGMLVVFDVLFNHVSKVSTEGAPYQLYAYLGLLPWTFFSSAVGNGGTTLLSNMSLLNKMYCPREVFPLAAMSVCAVDATVSTLVLVVLFPLNGFVPKITSFWVLPLLCVQVAFTAGVTFTISASVVYLRDLRHALAVMLQLGLFITPVAYSFKAIPAHLRPFYSALNPLGPVIGGYRRAVLLGHAPDLRLLGIAAVTSVAVLVFGYRLFKRLETGIADVA